MTELDFARRVATLLIVGHVVLFMFGFVVAVGGYLTGVDVAQLALMASPLLLAVAVPAFQFVMAEITTANDPGAADVHPMSAKLVYFVVAAFLFALFLLYGMGFFRSSLSPDQIKIGVGVVETALGGYLGVVRKRLFPDPPRDKKGKGNE